MQARYFEESEDMVSDFKSGVGGHRYICSLIRMMMVMKMTMMMVAVMMVMMTMAVMPILMVMMATGYRW